MSKNIIRASVVQACTIFGSLEDTLRKLDMYAHLAKDDGAELVVFPEAFIGGYPKFSTFGVAVGERTPEGRDEFVRYYKSAIEIPSPAITHIESISAKTGMFLVVGVIERDGGTLYCTAVFVDPAKGYVGKHRKLTPTAMERVIWGQGDASTLTVVDKAFDGGINTKITAAICWENYMPLLRSYYYSKAKGTHIYCAPTIDARPTWQHTMNHIALEGRCFVLSACQFSQEKDYPSDHAITNDWKRDPSNVIIAGGSVIISPLGVVLAGPLLEREGLLTANLDMDDNVRGYLDLDVVGHYARPDIFRLAVNEGTTGESVGL